MLENPSGDLAASAGLWMRAGSLRFIALRQDMKHDDRIVRVGIGHHGPVHGHRPLLEFGQFRHAAHRTDRNIRLQRLGLQHQFNYRCDSSEGQGPMGKFRIAARKRHAVAGPVQESEFHDTVSHDRTRAEPMGARGKRPDDRLFHVIAGIEQSAIMFVAQIGLQIADRYRRPDPHGLADRIVGHGFQAALAHQHRRDAGDDLHTIVTVRLPDAAIFALGDQLAETCLVLRDARFGQRAKDVDEGADPTLSFRAYGARVCPARHLPANTANHLSSPLWSPLTPQVYRARQQLARMGTTSSGYGTRRAPNRSGQRNTFTEPS